MSRFGRSDRDVEQAVAQVALSRTAELIARVRRLLGLGLRASFAPGALGPRPAVVLFAQIEAQAALVGLDAGILKRPFQQTRIALEQLQCLAALDQNSGAHRPAIGEVETDFDATQLRRMEAELDPVLPGLDGVVDAQGKLLRRAGRRRRGGPAIIKGGTGI